ncbi:MAG: hypothetical protein WKG00_25470 [Polyangiaceae bacterium]
MRGAAALGAAVPAVAGVYFFRFGGGGLFGPGLRALASIAGLG